MCLIKNLIMKKIKKISLAIACMGLLIYTFLTNNNYLESSKSEDVTLENIIALSTADAESGGMVNCALVSNLQCYIVCPGGPCDIYYGLRY